MPFVSLNMIKSSMCDCLHDRLNNKQWILVFQKYQSILERKEAWYYPLHMSVCGSEC